MPRSPARRSSCGSSSGRTIGRLPRRAEATSRTRHAARHRLRGAHGAVSGPMPVRSTSCGVTPSVEQHVRERRRLGRRVPAVHVERRIGLGDPLGLHVRQRGRERLAVLERGQDVVGRAVHDAAKALDPHRRHRLAHEIEDRDAVHHGAFEEEPHAAPLGERRQFPIRKRRRSLVGGDDVAAGRERDPDVIDRAAGRRRCRASSFPRARAGRRGLSASRAMTSWLPVTPAGAPASASDAARFDQRRRRHGVDARGVVDGAVPAGGDAGRRGRSRSKSRASASRRSSSSRAKRRPT